MGQEDVYGDLIPALSTATPIAGLRLATPHIG
jgi:hypothetical protein